MDLKTLRNRCEALGYALDTNKTDFMGRKWKYRTAPTKSGGGTNYFDRKEDIVVWLDDVEKIRRWDQEYDDEHRDLTLDISATGGSDE